MSRTARTTPTAAPAPRTRAVTAEGHRTRTDIQGLRAIAVAAVVVYHLWPHALPGGFVGVDVFFVLSGFLITAHLLRRPPTTVRELGAFWGRRIRRLLPASALVTVVTVIASAMILPTSLLPETSTEGAASALYVQNWSLAATASDYLAAEGAATPFRHYWSLSVEEQFYLVWPVLIGLAVLGTALVRRRRRALGATTGVGTGPDGGPAPQGRTGVGVAVAVVLALVVLASFAWSVHLVGADPARAYYVTPGRMWELGLGGLVALVAPRVRRLAVPARVREGAAWVGLAAVAWSFAALSGTTSFPGLGAVAPVVGTALVVLAEVPDGGVLGRALARRPVQVLGDVSYSTYLWHWPLIVFAPYVLGGRPGVAVSVGIAVASVALAWVTKRWVEDPVRRSPRLARPRWTVGVLLTCTVTAAGAAAWLSALASARESATDEDAVLAAAAREHPECFGAAATRPGAECAHLAGVEWTSPARAAADLPVVYDDDCWNELPFDTRRTCDYPASGSAASHAGASDGAPLRVALVGNCLAGQWFPPLEALAADRGWDVTTYLAFVCPPVDVAVDFSGRFSPEASSTGCSDWNDWVRDEVVGGGYDLVMMSALDSQALAGVDDGEQEAAARESYARVLDELTAARSDVLVIRSTPGMGETPVPECLEGFGAAACERPREDAVYPDPLADAADDDGSDRTAVLDVTDALCSDRFCHPVVGGLIAYSDQTHLTAELARTFTPELADALDSLLAGR